MSTRGCIARKTDNGFKGRYHHWDSYPEGLGKALWDLWHGFFMRDTDAMLSCLLDDHPAGWSSIVQADFAQPAGFGSEGPQCYCHGQRSESGQILTQSNAARCGVEYAYVFDGDTMTILSAYSRGRRMIGCFGTGDPRATWHTIARVSLSGPEPDWATLQAPQPAKQSNIAQLQACYV